MPAHVKGIEEARDVEGYRMTQLRVLSLVTTKAVTPGEGGER